MTTPLLRDIVAGTAGKGAFALLFRPQSDVQDMLDVFAGEMGQFDTLESIPLADAGTVGEEVLVLIPYGQVRERGFASVDGGERFLGRVVMQQESAAADARCLRFDQAHDQGGGNQN